MKKPKGVELSIEELFAQCDLDHDGYITAQELKRSLKKRGIPATQQYVDFLFEHLDTDHHNRISLEEFRTYCRLQQEKITEVFNALDKDQAG